MMSCPCRSMSERRWSITCATVALAVSAVGWCCRLARRIAKLSPGAVSAVVVRACKRAGLERVGDHRLRHTIATELLRRGAPLPEIGQLLRHQNIDTTAIYAKVDRRALSRLALPWPGSES